MQNHVAESNLPEDYTGAQLIQNIRKLLQCEDELKKHNQGIFVLPDGMASELRARTLDLIQDVLKEAENPHKRGRSGSGAPL